MQFCSVVNIQWFVTIVQKLGTFKIVFQILGCRNDKRSVLLLYLLNRHIQLQITAVARLLFRRENTFDFAGGRGGGLTSLCNLLKYTYLTRLVKVIIRILQPFMFFLSLGFTYYFFNPLNFYPVTLFLVTPCGQNAKKISLWVGPYSFDRVVATRCFVRDTVFELQDG